MTDKKSEYSYLFIIPIRGKIKDLNKKCIEI